MPNLQLAASRSFEARSEGITPVGSHNGSGRNSIFAGEVGGPDGSANWEVGMSGGGVGRREAVKDAEVREEKARAALRAMYALILMLSCASCWKSNY